jgi:hypothetical protein
MPRHNSKGGFKIPILYEDFPSKRKLQGGTVDSENAITVKLATGKGIILSVVVYDPNGNQVQSAFNGESLGMVISVQNQGDTDDIFVTVVDNDNNMQPIVRADGVKCSFYTTVNAGQTWGMQVASAGDNTRLTMPNRNWNLTVQAGHGTLGTQV